MVLREQMQREDWIVLICFELRTLRARGSVVVEALCCKPEGCGFETLVLTQPVTEMSTRIKRIMFLGSKVLSVHRADNLAPSVSRLFKRCGILNISEPYRPPWPVTGIWG
jgi:hypothetical protein